MRFDEGSGSHRATPWETAHESSVRRWLDAGYPSAPRILYWNERPAKSVPVTKTEEGVMMLSGFSSSLLEAFVAGNMDKFSPILKMIELLGKECYLRLRLSARRTGMD
ncbi:hypothetical protein ACHAXA_005315 [Cyclostephanos tholiformis]|uniref:DUF7788 domain-containing protein n=1 Tax=Cyclostephanos tholiformis TaxID=382380 RepID=A0ABD3REL1_9STRA